MLALLGLMAPFFALILIGWGAARRGLLPLDGIGALMVFVLYFALSAMVFQLGAHGHVAPGIGGALLAYALGSLVTLVLGLWWCARQGASRRDAGMTALVGAYPNGGFLGLPLLTGMLGMAAAGPISVALMLDVMITTLLATAWSHSQGGADVPLTRVVGASLKGAVRNPVVQAMVAGLAWHVTGWTMPKPVDDMIRLLAQAASPAALFALGAIVYRSQVSKAARASVQQGGGAVMRSHQRIWPVMVGLKLLVHPALVWGISQVLLQRGWDIHPLAVTAVSLAAALPSASNVSMMAEREGADAGLVAQVILWSTVLALGTVLVWAMCLGVSA